MVSVKELKSIDLASFTIISTGIALMFSIISAILLTIVIGITSPSAIGASIYIITTIIVGTLMYSIYNSFFQGFLYNTLAKKMNTIKIAFKDEKEIIKISTTETAIIISMIITIQTILIYLVSVFLLPLLLSSVVQTLMYSGQSMLAYSIYQFMMLLSQPMTIAMIIFGTFIISFIFILLGCYIYNILANSGRGAVVSLSKEGNLTAIDSIDVLKFAIIFAVISCVLNLILGIIALISGGNFASIIGSVIGGLIAGFVEGALLAVFYNFLAPKLGKLKLELIDF
ncbi:hypothetical protein [uncultured Methanobrevibacter sp.]|uniref:hypothetical protein n=1 Tax=uncultured Methanobrevibacter sp. TaxID=253161 RepID=UPI0026296D5F|nr:hypothetical protein [uncultured Methanobrevibacter sp.]